MNARELLEHATPRPWKLVDDDPESCPYIVPDEADPIATIWDIDPAGNAALIVAAVNEYEALLDCRDALAAMRSMALSGEPYSQQMRDVVDGALARLDAVRSGVAEPPLEFVDAHDPDRGVVAFLKSKELPAVDAASQVDRIASRRSDELPRYIQINRANFRVDAETLTGEQIRGLPNPPIGKDYDLWKLEPFGEDSLVADSDVIDLRGARFFSSPSIINAGAPAVDAPPEPTT